MQMFYLKIYASVKTIETETLYVKIFTLNPAFCSERKG